MPSAVCLADSIKELIDSRFANVIEEALTANAPLLDEDHEFFVELVLIAAKEIDQNAALLYTMAKTYYDISNMHMMHHIAGIGHLLALDDTDERRQALNSLKNDTLVTSTKVTNMVQERQLAYKLSLHDRQAQL
ncbi:unnamed protein product [Rotaria sp. Silwood2]|nr:unnamed protein product [Rotaria sp. Silwood2]CAF2877603.1 unnamed protein product [Rotaria sp. Silwood2]CAF3359785.1 unnamed protein product [Rotaria sp. Silwood2]CAF4000478.1 unnamed protein product [Rotaria sp. Silwood2]CAF4000562.1 unnamed protein product [Rotaria sp. Silwood2]